MKSKIFLVFEQYLNGSPNLVYLSDNKDSAYDFMRNKPPGKRRYSIQEFPGVEVHINETEQA